MSSVTISFYCWLPKREQGGSTPHAESASPWTSVLILKEKILEKRANFLMDKISS